MGTIKYKVMGGFQFARNGYSVKVTAKPAPCIFGVVGGVGRVLNYSYLDDQD
jgi:hypothetical protein